MSYYSLARMSRRLNATLNYSRRQQLIKVTAFETLSSGFRINSAKDDCGSLQISNRLTTQFCGLNMACETPTMGISFPKRLKALW